MYTLTNTYTLEITAMITERAKLVFTVTKSLYSSSSFLFRINLLFCINFFLLIFVV